jgi:hypothetical protein
MLVIAKTVRLYHGCIQIRGVSGYAMFMPFALVFPLNSAASLNTEYRKWAGLNFLMPMHRVARKG